MSMLKDAWDQRCDQAKQAKAKIKHQHKELDSFLCKVAQTAPTGPWPDVQVLHRSFPEAVVRHIAQNFCWPEGSYAD